MKMPDCQDMIERYISDGGFAGAALLVAKHGQIINEIYAGEAAPGLAASPRVLWPLASISKVYTAAMIMRLVEMGELTLNMRVCTLIPDFTGGGREDVRLRHLLTHTAGMIYESPEMEQRLIAQTPIADLIQEALREPLKFAPGTALDYADNHYLIAGHLAEIVTGQTFPELMQSLVLQPMGLEATFMPPPPTAYNQLAYVRGVMAEGTIGAMYNSPYALGLAHPAFGTVATARDLVRFTLHFMPGGPRIHSEATVRAMTSDQTGVVPGIQPLVNGYANQAPQPWGLGWWLQTVYVPASFSELASFKTFGHGGASGCQIVADPEQGLVIAVVSNTHARTGRDAWHRRLQSLVNMAIAAA